MFKRYHPSPSKFEKVWRSQGDSSYEESDSVERKSRDQCSSLSLSVAVTASSFAFAVATPSFAVCAFA